MKVQFLLLIALKAKSIAIGYIEVTAATNIIRNQEQLQNLLNDIDNAIFIKEELNTIIVREEQAFEGILIQ